MTSVNSISTVAAAASSSSGSSSAIKDETKKKLEDLGLNPNDYSSESAAESAIAQKQQEISSQQSGQQKGESGAGGGNQNFQDEVNTLAESVGVSTSGSSGVGDMLDKISAKIDELQTTATDEDKKSEVASYQQQYQDLEDEYVQMESAQNMVGATAQGNYNKASLGLS